MAHAERLGKIKLIKEAVSIEDEIKSKKRVILSEGRVSPRLCRLFSYLPITFIERLSYGACVELNGAYAKAAGQEKQERGYTRDEHLKWTLILAKEGVHKAMHADLLPWLQLHAHYIQHISAFYRVMRYLFIIHLADHSINTYELREITGTTSVLVTLSQMRKSDLIGISGNVYVITSEGKKRVTSYCSTDKGRKLVELALDFLERKENGLRASLKKRL